MENAETVNFDADARVATSTALVRRSPFEQARELAHYMNDIGLIADVLCKSTLLPMEMQVPANMRLVLAQGMEMGFTPLQAIRASFVTPGSKDGKTPPKVGYYVQSLLALIHSNRVCRYFRIDETTATKCRVSCARTDEPDDIVHRFELTIEQAREANMDKTFYRDNSGQMRSSPKHPWMASPADMLVWRTSGRAAKVVFPDVVFGMATPDDHEDIASVDVMDRAAASDGFVPVPAPTNQSSPRAAASSSSPTSSSAAVPPATSPDVVDAELVHDDAPPASSGDPAWDQLLHAIAQITNEPAILQALPEEIKAAWDLALEGARTRKDVNGLAPWIGEANRRSAQSKNCAEVAAHFQKTFNDRNAKLREAERAAKAAGGAA